MSIPLTSVGAANRPRSGYDVFISHKSEYKPWVEWLARALMACGYSVFLDVWELVPGDNWVEGLHRGLEQSRAGVLVATPEVVHSGWVREEYAVLLRRRQADPAFRLVPIVFGALPQLPFLENLQAVDARDPARYREALHRLLCGLAGRAPGGAVHLPAPIDPPPALRLPLAGDMVPSEEPFVRRIMQDAARAHGRPQLIVARGQRHQGPVIQALRERARAGYGAQALLHITPPFSEQASVEACFRELGRQCRFEHDTPDAIAFTVAMERRLEAADAVFLLVTGFENANSICRAELAGALRTLSERASQVLRVALVGGLRLLEQKYEAGTLSYLTHAELQEWPQPSLGDVIALQQRDYANAQLDTGGAQALLDVSGGHGGLIRYGLERLETEGGAPRWAEWSYVCPELRESWHALARYAPERLREALGRDSFGPVVPWSNDPTARRLYWADLLAGHGTALRWRADVIQRVGNEELG